MHVLNVVKCAARAGIAALCLVLAAGAAMASDGYRVGPGDSLNVSIFGQPDLSGPVQVRDTGAISLHLLGEIDVTQKTLEEIEGEIIARAVKLFGGQSSVVVEIEKFRDLFVMGEVATPGAYEFQPGMTVIKAIATAGGYNRATENTSTVSLEGARRRLIQSQSRYEFASAELKAVEAELLRLEGDGVTITTVSTQGDTPDTAQEDLVAMRRELLTQSIDRAERQGELAREEAASFSQRRALIEQQLAAMNEQLDIQKQLVGKGLSRRDRFLQLEVDVADFRADVLEATAFEARARQVAANADSTIEIARTQYREDLVADRIAAQERMELARADYESSVQFIQENAGTEAVTDLVQTHVQVFDIFRQDGSGRTVQIAGDLATPLMPEDVLVVRLELVLP